MFGRIIIFTGEVGQMPGSPSTHEAEEVDWHKVRHMGVAQAFARWPVAERPNVFHISTATVAFLHLLHSKMDPRLDQRMLLCFCLCCRLCMFGHGLTSPSPNLVNNYVIRLKWLISLLFFSESKRVACSVVFL